MIGGSQNHGAISGTGGGGMHGWWTCQQAWGEMSGFFGFLALFYYILFGHELFYFIETSQWWGGSSVGLYLPYDIERLYYDRRIVYIFVYLFGTKMINCF
jgi:hypothetical protein